MTMLLSILSDELSDEAIQALTFEITNTLNKETDATASIVETEGKAGHKGVDINWRQILITALGSGGAITAMLGVLKTYILTRPSLEMKLKLPDGKELSIKSQNLQQDQFDQLVKMIKKAFGG